MRITQCANLRIRRKTSKVALALRLRNIRMLRPSPNTHTNTHAYRRLHEGDF